MSTQRGWRSWPAATGAGVMMGTLIALIGAALSFGPLEDAAHPLLAYALAPVPALAGVWIDWARLWRPSPRVRLYSGGALLASGALAVDVGLAAAAHRDLSFALTAPLALFGVAAAVLAGARVLSWVAERGGALGWRVLAGQVRRDERDRVVVDTPEGALELDRRSAELGAQQRIALEVGSPVAVLARGHVAVPDRDPFRTERRVVARRVFAVAESRDALAARVRGRAGAWALYLALLAVAAGAMAATGAYAAPVENVRGPGCELASR